MTHTKNHLYSVSIRTTHSVTNHVFKLVPLEILTHDTLQFYARSANFPPIRMLLMDFELKKHFMGRTSWDPSGFRPGKGLFLQNGSPVMFARLRPFTVD